MSVEKSNIDIIYEDDNIIICFKPRNLETISNEGDSLEKRVMAETGSNIFAVHRLDANTIGLVVFAKTPEAKISLDSAFKEHTVKKIYVCLVYGHMKEKTKTLEAYLKKDAKKARVQVSDSFKKGFTKIITKYRVLSEDKLSSILEVELVTGKTHQIRAHLAHIGHPVIGDDKYGYREVNRAFKKRYQCLVSKRITFNFEKDDVLGYLIGKTFEIDDRKIDFLSK